MQNSPMDKTVGGTMKRPAIMLVGTPPVCAGGLHIEVSMAARTDDHRIGRRDGAAPIL